MVNRQITLTRFANDIQLECYNENTDMALKITYSGWDYLSIALAIGATQRRLTNACSFPNPVVRLSKLLLLLQTQQIRLEIPECRSGNLIELFIPKIANDQRVM